MSDLIERQAAIKAILAIKDYGNSDRANALGLAEFAITTLPSAQPERTGHWIHDGSQWKERWICDKCGCKLFGVRTDYCGGCGARMMEVEND